jgi:hypothetical protein
VRLSAAAMAEARDLAELLHVLVYEAAAPLGAGAGLLAALEPDGALRIVAAAGYDASVVSAWHRIPPTLDVPLQAAVVRQAPVLLADVRERAERFPLTRDLPATYEAQASLPLVADGRAVGVLGLSWSDRRRFDRQARALLAEVARAAAEPFLTLLRRDGDALDPVAPEVVGSRWFRAVLDSVQIPALLLTPLREPTGEVADLAVAFANAAAVAAVQRTEPLLGRRLLELYPGAVASGVFATCLAVLRTGTPERLEAIQDLDAGGPGPGLRLLELAIAKLGDGLLVTWLDPLRTGWREPAPPGGTAG